MAEFPVDQIFDLWQRGTDLLAQLPSRRLVPADNGGFNLESDGRRHVWLSHFLILSWSDFKCTNFVQQAAAVHRRSKGQMKARP